MSDVAKPSDLEVRYVRETQGVEAAKRLVGGNAARRYERSIAGWPVQVRKRGPWHRFLIWIGAHRG